MNQYINIGTNIETFILLAVFVVGVVGLIYFLRLDWKRFGLLFLISALVGNIICLLFVKLGFYSYPYRLFPRLSTMPITAVTTSFPLLVLIGVRYSPKIWAWKIPFYWVIIHIGMFFETLVLKNTRIIEYNFKWDFWDSYTWWWIYLLLFEWLGGKIVPDHLRKPLNIQHLHYGKVGWFIIHFVLIVTIFLGGYYVGTLK
ncbi:CBO0543 family protein [Bacillus solitudinis]|uniref:CBO0543 family protein n=1 Tax=Bacillus solitudinis TaxID=2014074 RepID=UPI000C24853D|nr:CBO0543 family protein [Bacillus solitudinis]